MPIQPRGVLKPLFAKGQRPKEQHFHDWLDSFYHKTEDSVKISGWVFRSFFKDLRGEAAPITNGGQSMIEIPPSVSKLKKLRVFGNGSRTNPALNMNITVQLVYISDIKILSLGGADNDIPQIPITLPAATFFRHIIVNSIVITAPPVAVNGNAFSGEVVFPSPGIDLQFTDFRFFRLRIDASAPTANITFPAATNSFIYYGFEYE